MLGASSVQVSTATTQTVIFRNIHINRYTNVYNMYLSAKCSSYRLLLYFACIIVPWGTLTICTSITQLNVLCCE